MANIIDARGRSCPEPVILTKNAFDSSDEDIMVLVDTRVAVENITRFAEGKGYKVNVLENKDHFKIDLQKAYK